MKSPTQLFRPEVLSSRLSEKLGPIALTLPLRFEICGWLGGLWVACLCLYVLLAAYADSVLVPGYIDTQPGMIPVYSARSGIVSSSNIQSGQWVKKGQELFVVQLTDSQRAKRQQPVLTKFAKLKQALVAEISQKRKQLIRLTDLVAKHYLSQVELDQFQKEIQSSEQQLAELSLRQIQLKSEQLYSVVSPINGWIGEIKAEVGRAVRVDQEMVVVMPERMKWMVKLLVPVKAMRFVVRNQDIQIRYDAYPFFHYGTFAAKIRMMSPVLTLPNEQKLPVGSQEPFYLVEADLQHKHPRLAHGMSIQAILTGEKRLIWRRLVGWIA